MTNHLDAALRACAWNITASRHGERTRGDIGHRENDTRARWRRIVLALDSTSQATRLPADPLAWAAHEVTVAGWTMRVRPIVGAQLPPDQRVALRQHVTDVMRAGVQPRLAR